MIKFVLLFAAWLLICSFLLSAGVSAETDLVAKICNVKKDYSYDACVDALSADPESKTAQDFTKLGKIAIHIAIKNTTTTQDYIKQKWEAGGSVAYKNCLGLYGSSIRYFNMSVTEIDADPLTASYDVRIAGQYAIRCSSEMYAMKMRDPVLAAGNRYITLFSNIGAVITDELS